MTGGVMGGRTRIGILGTVLAISASLGQAMTAGPVAASSTCTWWGNPQPVPVGASSGLSDVAVLSRCNAWVVGSSSSHALLEHWNGQQWSVKQDPFVGSTSDTLAALLMTSASNGWAAGHAGENTGPS